MLPSYQEINCQEPDLESLSEIYAQLEEDLSNPETDPREVIRTWDVVRRETATWQNLVELRFNQDTRNRDFIAAQERCDEISPRLTELDIRIKKLILEGPHREAIRSWLGNQVFAIWNSEALSFTAKIKQDLVEESKLAADYNALLSAAEMKFEGEVYNHEGIDQFRYAADRDQRYQSIRKKWQWFAEHSGELDDLFDRLVRTRHKMARTLGFENYLEMGYLRRCRVDYDTSDVAGYRRQVRDHVVPFCRELIEKKRNALDLKQVHFWDESVHGCQGNPRPQGDCAWMMEQAKKMFFSLSEELGQFFDMMTDRQLLDLVNREGKGGGGFCTDFPKHGLPFIFANFNSTADDVRVFTHEVGHAFQGYSSRHQEVYDYVWPTYESCEIHSMGLEFMTFPQMERFFGDQAPRFCREHVIDSFLFFPYGVAVDHFQHLVYQNPDASPAERMEMWKEMESTYLPWRDYGDLPHLVQGGRWQLQRHIFMYPLYYIDYTLALSCALQLWQKSCEAFETTLESYHQLCRMGGRLPFRELTASANLQSPFEEGTLAQAVEFARGYLDR